MNRTVSSLMLLTFLLMALLLPAGAAYGESAVSLYLDGTRLNSPMPPRIENSSTLVPVRVVAEALGAKVGWVPSSRKVTITRDSSQVQLTIDRKTAAVNGKTFSLALAPKLVNGTTMVPVRFVAEQFGVLVQWDQKTRSIHLRTSGGLNDKSSTASETPAAVLIYHSHNRESFLSLLPGAADSNEAYHVSKNIRLVGKRIAENLKSAGIEVIHAYEDYVSKYGSRFRVNQSYAYSAQTVKEQLKNYPQIRYIFDIHRDASPRDETTIEIGGNKYARLFFVIGMENPDWRKNEGFARQLETWIEAKYPGLSRGIFYKDRSAGDGWYNQNLSPRSALIEIGGAYNTMTEVERTADILSEAIAQLLRS